MLIISQECSTHAKQELDHAQMKRLKRGSKHYMQRHGLPITNAHVPNKTPNKGGH